MSPFLFNATRSRLLDPFFEARTTDVEKAAWVEYTKSITEALYDYEAEKEKARFYYLEQRKLYIAGTSLQPALGQVLFYSWPTDTQIQEFDKREAGQLAEFEKMIFNAAREYAHKERDARLAYWQAVESGEAG
jgi:hypothetical protein